MSDTLVVSLSALVVIGLIKVYSDKPQDSEGRTILSLFDRIVGLLVILFAVAGIAFAKIDLYGVANPLIFVSPVLIGAYVIYNRLQNRSKKNKRH